MTLNPATLRAMLLQGLEDDDVRGVAADYLEENGHDDLAALLRDPDLIGVWRPAPAREPGFFFVTDAEGVVGVGAGDASPELVCGWGSDRDEVVYAVGVHDGKRVVAWWFREPFRIPTNEVGIWYAGADGEEGFLGYDVHSSDGKGDEYR
jgi:hypothetical protein